jgi:hypothetical protein
MMCLKCWRACAAGPDGHYPHGYESQAEAYAALLAEKRRSGAECSPREQAQEYWDEERGVDTRRVPR